MNKQTYIRPLGDLGYRFFFSLLIPDDMDKKG